MAHSAHAKVQLFFRGKNLLDSDTFSKSDPYVKVFDQSTPSAPIGKTETVRNNPNPVFKTPVVVTYFFEVKQVFKVELWDEDKGKDDFLGVAEFTMGSLMSAKDATLTLSLSTRGSVTVTGVAIGTNRGMVSLGFEGRDLKKMDLFGKSDPYLVLSRVLPSGERKKVYQSEVVKKNLNPKWNPVPPLDTLVLCGGDREDPCILIECFNCGALSSSAMGMFKCTLSQLLEPGAEFELKMEKSGKMKSYGFIRLARNDFAQLYSFTEYLRSGMEVNVAFSIDFTGSNGPCTDPRSLHYYHPTQPNDYIKAMIAVSNVVQEYDSDRLFPAYGFGAITPWDPSTTSHFFPLTGTPENAYLQGMQSVVNSYAALLPQLRFSGPTNFAPTIRTITQGARNAKGVYTILLILTDGAITDMADTIDALVEADDAPLSILIVGVGQADFASMVRLDGDGEVLKSRHGRKSRRDLVQFVPMRDYASKSPEQLAAALLEEVPTQVEVWAQLNNVKPEALRR